MEETKEQYELWRNVDAQRSFDIARLEGRNTEREFLYVTYDGPDALKAFKQDFEQFAHIKNANVAQIFGYNDNERGLPALIFYDALIPLGRIVLKGYQFFPLLYSYFAHQFGKIQRELAVGNLLLGELWVEPRTGALQKGPYVEPPFQSWIMDSTCENTLPNTHSTPLPIQTYSDNDTVFEYLTRTFTAWTILTGIRLCHTGFLETLANKQVIPVLSSLPGAIHNLRSGDIIARLPQRWYHEFWRVEGRIPDGMRESQVIVYNGLMRRFTVTLTELQELQRIALRYSLHLGGACGILAQSWLAQAHSVFSQLGIHEDDWEDYSILASFLLCLERTSPHQEPNIASNVYLFIRPVPHPSDDDAVWGSWLEGEKYFWSFDPLGREMVPELVRGQLGLPSFASMINVCHHTWSLGHYSAVQKLHTSEDFDPTTTDFALSLGLPILDVVGGKSRFEDLEEPRSYTLPPTGDNPQGASRSKKPRTVFKPVQSIRTNPEQQQLRDVVPNSTINPSGKSRGPEKRMNSQDARPFSTRVQAYERNLKSIGHSSNSIPTSATNSPQPTRPSTSGKKKPVPAVVSVERTTRQVGGAIDQSKRPQDHGQADRKAGQPKPPSRKEVKPAWR